MGLEEKRLVKQLKDEVVPRYEKELTAIVGSPITYDVDWDGFAEDRDALGYFESRILTEVQTALRAICRDDLGKEAVQDAIKTVRVGNRDNSSCDDITISGEALHLACDWGYGTLWDAESIVQRVGAML